VRRADWSDGAPLFAVPVAATLRAAGMFVPTRPAHPLLAARRPPTPKPPPADDAAHGGAIHALRQAGACWAAVRIALHYESVRTATSCYRRWCAATATPPVPDRVVRDAARRARITEAVLGVLR